MGTKDIYRIAGVLFTAFAEAGVDINFAAETLKTPNDSMWYPNRQELVDAGVINGSGIAMIKPRMRPIQPEAPEIMSEVELSLLKQ